MIADIVQTGLSLVGARSAFAAGLVSCLSPRVAAVARLPRSSRASRSRRGVGRRSHAAGADPAVHPGFTIVFVLLGAFASTFVKVFKGTTAAGGRRDRDTFGVLMIGYALRRGIVGALRRAPACSSPACAGASARCRSAWLRRGLDPRIGPCSGRSSRSPRAGSTARAVVPVRYSAGLGVPFLLVGLGVTRFMRHSTG